MEIQVITAAPPQALCDLQVGMGAFKYRKLRNTNPKLQFVSNAVVATDVIIKYNIFQDFFRMLCRRLEAFTN